MSKTPEEKEAAELAVTEAIANLRAAQAERRAALLARDQARLDARLAKNKLRDLRAALNRMQRGGK